MNELHNSKQNFYKTDNITTILLDLTMYENKDLCLKSFDSLFEIIFKKKSLFEILEKMQILEDPSLIEEYEKMKDLTEKISSDFDSSENWYFSCDQKSIEKIDEISIDLNKVILFATEKNFGNYLAIQSTI